MGHFNITGMWFLLGFLVLNRNLTDVNYYAHYLIFNEDSRFSVSSGSTL